MKTKLIAMVALAAASNPFLAADVAVGEPFEVDAADAESLLTDGQAKLASAAPAAASKAEKKVKARVLAVCNYGQPNDVVELSASEAKAAEADGLVDADKTAVAFAASVATPPPDHPGR